MRQQWLLPDSQQITGCSKERTGIPKIPFDILFLGISAIYEGAEAGFFAAAKPAAQRMACARAA